MVTVKDVTGSVGFGGTGWVIPASRKWGPSQTFILNLTVWVAPLSVGTHNGQFTVRHSGKVIDIPITAIVTAQGQLLPSRSRLFFAGTKDGAPPAAQSITLPHSGPNPFNWTARANESWVTLAPTSGTSSDTSELTIGIAASKMGQLGKYEAKVFINDGAQDHEVAVTLEVTDANAEKVVLTGLEVTQVVQNLLNEIPLVAGKKTFVRAHVRSRSGGTVSNVTAKLTGKRGGTTLGAIHPSNKGGSIAVKTDPSREQLDESFYFELPSGWTSGEVTLIFAGESQTITCQESAGGTANDCQATVTFQTVAALPVKLVDLNYIDQNAKPDQAMRDEFIREVISIFPIADITLSRYPTPLEYSGLPLYKPDDVKKEWKYAPFWYKALGDLASLSKDDTSKTYWFGLSASLGAGMAGLGQMPGYNAIGARVGSTEAHEMGHNLTLPHAPCGGPGSIDPNYPYSDGRISGALSGDGAFYGFDTKDMKVKAPTCKDFMTYCGNEWISDYYYKKLFDEIKSRHGRASADVAPASIAVAANQNAILVSGVLAPTQGSGEIGPVIEIVPSGDIPTPEPGDYTLRLEDEQGTELASQSFGPVLTQEQAGTASEETFSIALPHEEGASKVVLLQSGVEIASRTASANEPTVTMTFPNGGEDFVSGAETVTWEAGDADGDSLTYIVEYSLDGGGSWSTLAAEWTEESFELDIDVLPGSQQALIRVAANDGFHTTRDQSDSTFTVSGKPPIASILVAAGEQVLVGDQEIALEGYAIDYEDGVLTGDALTWYTDRQDAPLGTGTSLTLLADDLATGQHVITLIAEDSAGNSSSTDEASADASLTDSMIVKVYRDRPTFLAELAVAPGEIGLATQVGSSDMLMEVISIRKNGDGEEIAWEATVEGTIQPQLSISSGTTSSDITVSLDASTLQTVGAFTGTITIAPAATETREISAVEIPYTVNVDEREGSAIYLPLIMKN